MRLGVDGGDAPAMPGDGEVVDDVWKSTARAMMYATCSGLPGTARGGGRAASRDGEIPSSTGSSFCCTQKFP